MDVLTEAFTHNFDSINSCVPESPRWLVAENRIPEAAKIIRRIAKGNGTQLPPNFEEELQDEYRNKIVELIFVLLKKESQHPQNALPNSAECSITNTHFLFNFYN